MHTGPPSSLASARRPSRTLRCGTAHYGGIRPSQTGVTSGQTTPTGKEPQRVDANANQRGQGSATRVEAEGFACSCSLGGTARDPAGSSWWSVRSGGRPCAWSQPPARATNHRCRQRRAGWKRKHKPSVALICTFCAKVPCVPDTRHSARYQNECEDHSTLGRLPSQAMLSPWESTQCAFPLAD